MIWRQFARSLFFEISKEGIFYFAYHIRNGCFYWGVGARALASGGVFIFMKERELGGRMGMGNIIFRVQKVSMGMTDGYDSNSTLELKDSWWAYFCIRIFLRAPLYSILVHST
jgi:hypothetical protein